jgi:hypothetical protein
MDDVRKVKVGPIANPINWAWYLCWMAWHGKRISSDLFGFPCHYHSTDSPVIHLTLRASLNNTLKQQNEAAELDTDEDASMGIERHMSAERMSGSVEVKAGGHWTTPYGKDAAITGGIQINFPCKNCF